MEDIIVVEDNAPTPDLVVEEDSEDITIANWTDSNKFFNYIVKAARSIPLIDKNSKNSLRRAASYCDKMKKELIAGIESDAEEGELSLEQLRFLDEIEAGFEETEIQASGKKALLRYATKSTQITMVVDPFTYAIARVCINAKVANGKNIEETFKALKSKYNMNEREQLATIAVLNDMGYPCRASWVDGNIDMIKQYFG